MYQEGLFQLDGQAGQYQSPNSETISNHMDIDEMNVLLQNLDDNNILDENNPPLDISTINIGDLAANKGT